MFLTSVAIAGGVLTVGVKRYRDHKRKKEYPWTVAAERMAKNDLALVNRQHRSVKRGGMVARVSENMGQLEARSQAFTQEIIAPFARGIVLATLANVTVDDLGGEQSHCMHAPSEVAESKLKMTYPPSVVCTLGRQRRKLGHRRMRLSP
jgi:hypothetical protein